MPTITVDKAELYRRLEREYSTQEFDELCFDFGIESDEDTTEEVEAARTAGSPTPPPQLKIEIPANRYDSSCLEGLARSLRIFLEKETAPTYTSAQPAKSQESIIEPSTSPSRPMAAGAVIRLARPMNDMEYASFIDSQDKSHQNSCRMRKFVAIGTHDSDTIEGPFRYMCKDPNEIKFAPSNRETEHTAAESMTIYEQDRHSSKYLGIIRDAPAYPIIYDKNGQVLSMPPIINSDHSKIVAGKTTNIFVDTTATDQTKLDIVVMSVATMFAEYCKVPFEIEPVRVVMPDGTSRSTPDVSPRSTQASLEYSNAATGSELSREEACRSSTKMSSSATPSTTDPDALDVAVPCTRSDISHECDIMEDSAIAYGYNNSPTGTAKSSTVAKPNPVNKLGDILRREAAMAGWTEASPYILCSYDENYTWLSRKDPGGEAVRSANPKTVEFQVVRTTLLPGSLKTVRENKSLPLPLKVFEVSDICKQDMKEDRKARNARHMAAVYTDNRAGFEVVHGSSDRIMQILAVPFIESAKSDKEFGYYIAEGSNPSFMPGRAADVYLRPKPGKSTRTQDKTGVLENMTDALKNALPGHGRDICIGNIGVLHPLVLQNFDLTRPASALEISVEHLL